MLREREAAVLAECTFQPKLNTQKRPASTGRIPLHERVADVLRNKNEKLSNARIQMVRGPGVSCNCGSIVMSTILGRGSSSMHSLSLRHLHSTNPITPFSVQSNMQIKLVKIGSIQRPLACCQVQGQMTISMAR